MTMLSRKSCLLLKVLLNKYHHDPADTSILNALPMEMAKQVVDTSMPSDDAAAALATPQEALEKIHYSWIAEALRRFPESLRPHIAGCLPAHYITGISQMEQESSLKKADYPPSINQYLLGLLYQKIEGANEAIPEAFIPQQPLSMLLNVNRPVLLEGIDLLGMYDLAVKIKQIVNKEQLRRITTCLTPAKQKFLKVLLHQPDRVQMPELDLSYWQGNCSKLQKILHRRGLVRLSKAISGYPEDFLWHFTKRLDTGRANIIMRYYSEEESLASAILTEQVLFIINTLTQKSTP